MRMILFRGKCVSDGTFVYGTYIKSFRSSDESRKHWILCGAGHNGGALTLYDRYQVDGKTVGQFTGLHDRLYREIYEGDILKMRLGANEMDITEHDMVVTVQYGNMGYGSDIGFSGFTEDGQRIPLASQSTLEIIGNVHEAHE